MIIESNDSSLKQWVLWYSMFIEKSVIIFFLIMFISLSHLNAPIFLQERLQFYIVVYDSY